MGKHVYSVNLKMEIESKKIPDGESGAQLELTSDTIYQIMTNLRSDMFSELEELDSDEFKEAVSKASEINNIMSHLEELCELEDIEEIEFEH